MVESGYGPAELTRAEPELFLVYMRAAVAAKKARTEG